MDNLTVILKKWDKYQSNDINIYVCGHIQIHGNYITTAKQLFGFLKNHFNTLKFYEIDLSSLLTEMTGNFAIIIKSSSFLFAAVDICRTQPIFYYGNSFDNLFFFDSLPINNISKYGINKLNLLEFYELGFITGDKTIANDIKQLVILDKLTPHSGGN